MNSILLSSLLGAAATALDFQGTGQIRTWNTTGTDLGCLTKQAEWTSDDTQCDVFTGTRTNDTDIHLKTSTGIACGIDNIKVVCQDGLDAVSSKWMVSEKMEKKKICIYQTLKQEILKMFTD